MLTKIVRFLGGDPNKREVERLALLVDEINRLEPAFEALSDEALRGKTDEFRARLKDGATLNELLPEAFAAVREASKRTVGMRPFDVQLIGGMALHEGKIAEMRTGEGKTLVATLPLYLNSLEGRGTHLVTVNDYLARRDARWMAPIYLNLGLTVGVLQMATRTENGRNAFLVDLDRKSVHEDQDQLALVPRQEAYLADITYGTNSEFGFDYLRDNTAMRLEDRVQRGHHYAIVDEVDNILIDEARTPLIISGPASEDVSWYVRTTQVVRQLVAEDYEVSERDHAVSLTEVGEAHVEQLLEMPLRDPERPEDITPEQARVLGYLEQAMRAQFLFKRNKDYLVQAGKVIIVDEFTGRLMPGRRWSDGLHQAVEAKENVKIEAENVTYATITLQNYFRMYDKLAGMTGTALTEAEEFSKIYKLDVVPVPTNLEFQTFGKEPPLLQVEDRDEQGYKYVYYTRPNEGHKLPVFWKRKDYPDVVYRTEEAKLRAITQEIVRYHILGRPQLVGTTSVEHSERLSNRLRPELLRRLMQTLILRKAWLEQHQMEATEQAIPELMPLYTPLEELSAPDLRQMARTLDLSLNPEDEQNLARLLDILKLEPEDKAFLVNVLQGGVQHQVLNARKHDEESKIIARAGAFRAVTIATNMAGRGVDIKLGGELPDEIYQDIHRVLGSGSFDMTLEEVYQALKKLDPSQFGIYEEAVKAFWQYIEEMEKVRQLGGLHVIGSERHEARRIDNQLRGRSARQGDPGSSRFYLSLGDELMRLFGGEQVESLLKRLNVDEAMPMEIALVGRLIEQAQTRVEGSNFDIRKHLLEYDDVLNSQRKRIYEQRDRIFTKEDLTEDVVEMLRTDLQERILEALKDEEGPWKLLAYLEEVQPVIEAGGIFFPSYTVHLLLEHQAQKLKNTQKQDVLNMFTDLAQQALDAEQNHLLKSTRQILEKTEDGFDNQVNERMDAVETFIEGLRDQEEITARQTPALLEELTGLARVPVRLSTEQLQQAMNKPSPAVQLVREQIESALKNLTIKRLLLTLERRIDETLNLRPAQIQDADWPVIEQQVLGAVEEVFTRRNETLLGKQGQITHDLQSALERLPAGQPISQSQLVSLLGLTAMGSRVAFDQKTHRRVSQRMIRLRYIYLAAHLLEGMEARDVTEDVLQHLEQAQDYMRRVWGFSEYSRLQPLGATLASLDERLRTQLEEMLGEAAFIEVADRPLDQIPSETREVIIDVLGRRLQSEAYRFLLLGVISELWVDYLTRVEGLRVSIGLEAYAQRDPLVQYKGQASDMFRTLLSDIRMGVVSRMFTFRPRQVDAAQVDREAGITEEEAVIAQPAEPPRKKRKRH